MPRNLSVESSPISSISNSGAYDDNYKNNNNG